MMTESPGSERTRTFLRALTYAWMNEGWGAPRCVEIRGFERSERRFSFWRSLVARPTSLSTRRCCCTTIWPKESDPSGPGTLPYHSRSTTRSERPCVAEPCRSGVRRPAPARFSDFVFESLDLQYELSPTRDAIGTFQARSGNCLSFVNLFVGMSREVQLNPFYVEVTDFQRWNYREGVVVSQGHIVAGMSVDGELSTFDFLPYQAQGLPGFQADRRPDRDRPLLQQHRSGGPARGRSGEGGEGPEGGRRPGSGLQQGAQQPRSLLPANRPGRRSSAALSRCPGTGPGRCGPDDQPGSRLADQRSGTGGLRAVGPARRGQPDKPVLLRVPGRDGV